MRNPNLCNRCNTHTEEGRIVELTVLFADLTSFTALTNRLGPERTHTVVDTYLREASRIIAAHDGFIDKYVGDAVMAFFNAPIHCPDHAALAITAARELQAHLPNLSRQLGLDLRAGVGIASGWARVGRLGSADAKDYTAIGDVVNLAARLVGQIRPGEILIDQQAYESVASEFPELVPEALTLKGFDETMTAYRLNAGEAPRHAAHPPATSLVPKINVGAIVFAVLGAPCVAATLLGPLAVVLGLGSVFGATSVIWALDESPFYLPVLFLATLGALLNLYTIGHARRLRQRAAAGGQPLAMTRLERRRTYLVGGTAILTLLIVAYELYAHLMVMHHKFP